MCAFAAPSNRSSNCVLLHMLCVADSPCVCVCVCMLSGDLSPATAWVLVLVLAVGGLGIVATNFGPLITKVCT